MFQYQYRNINDYTNHHQSTINLSNDILFGTVTIKIAIQICS